jgi:hypothetical protein
MLEQLHCGIDISKKVAADQAVLDDERRKALRDYEENSWSGHQAHDRAKISGTVQAANPGDHAKGQGR